MTTYRFRVKLAVDPTALWRDIVIGGARSVVERAERDELLDRSGPTRRTFIEYLESGLVERDFREMF